MAVNCGWLFAGFRTGHNGTLVFVRAMPMPFNLPIFLTWLRIVLIPLVVGVFYVPDLMMAVPSKNLAAAVIFVLAALTDWFDGFLARKLNQTSAFGAFLDPVADKLMVTAALLILLELGRWGSQEPAPATGQLSASAVLVALS